MERFRTLGDLLGLSSAAKPCSRCANGWEWFQFLHVKSCGRSLLTMGMNATDGRLSPEDVLRLCVLSTDPFQTGNERELWALGGKLGKRLVLCPMRGQLVDAIVDALYRYEMMRRGLNKIAQEWYHEDNAALTVTPRWQQMRQLLRFLFASAWNTEPLGSKRFQISLNNSANAKPACSPKLPPYRDYSSLLG